MPGSTETSCKYQSLCASTSGTYGTFYSLSDGKTEKPEHVVKGSIISCKNVSYTVNVRPVGNPFARKTPQTILQNINAVFKPGLNAILGPTGSGKTTLLDILAGRKCPVGLQGTVQINDRKQPKNFRCMTGYVTQDDNVMGTLSVRENIMFSANLRISSKVSQKDKEQMVDSIISQLNLDKCADQRVGTDYQRGVSGGERKRTNIGIELVVSQSVLFLDEPTTGLDASTAITIIHALQRLVRNGTTVIISIHQPRFSIYKTFDKIMLLSLGKMIYHGKANQALAYFAELGYECEPHNNPPDFFLDVINAEPKLVCSTMRFSDTNGEISFTKKITAIEQNGAKDNGLTQWLHLAFLQTNWNRRLSSELNDISSGTVTYQTMHNKGDYATGPITQFFFVAQRQLRTIIRNPATLLAQCFVMAVFSLFVGFLFFKIPALYPEGLQNRVGAFFFVIMNMVFGNLGAIELFILERRTFIHESGSGYYRIAPYFLSKICCDIIPLRCFPTVIFSSIIYFMIGLVPSIDKWLIFTLNTNITTFCAAAIAFFVSASVSTFAIANLLVSLIYVFMMVFGGLLVNVNTLWGGIRWLQYFSAFRYSFNVLTINELEELEFFVEAPNSDTLIPIGYAGESYMDDVGISYGTVWDLWSNTLAIIGLLFAFLLLAYIQLRRMPKWK